MLGQGAEPDGVVSREHAQGAGLRRRHVPRRQRLLRPVAQLPRDGAERVRERLLGTGGRLGHGEYRTKKYRCSLMLR